MLFGIEIQPVYIITLGVLLVLLLVFQVLQGLRKIKFKGKTHLKVHKFAAWSILGIGFVHALIAFAYFYPQVFP